MARKWSPRRCLSRLVQDGTSRCQEGPGREGDGHQAFTQTQPPQYRDNKVSLPPPGRDGRNTLRYFNLPFF